MAASFDDALEAGQRARDWVGEWPIWCSTDGEAIRARFEAAADSEAIAPAKASRLKAARAALKQRMAEMFSASRCDSLRARYTGPDAASFWTPMRQARERDGRDSAKVDAERRTWERTFETMGILQRAGVHFLAGSEAGDLDIHPGFSLHDELELFVQLGMTPAQALRSATLEPARYLRGTDSLGTVAVGRLADLVLLDHDPLADITATRAINAVVANGRMIDSAGLVRLLEGAAKAAKAP